MGVVAASVERWLPVPGNAMRPATATRAGGRRRRAERRGWPGSGRRVESGGLLDAGGQRQGVRRDAVEGVCWLCNVEEVTDVMFRPRACSDPTLARR